MKFKKKNLKQLSSNELLLIGAGVTGNSDTLSPPKAMRLNKKSLKELGGHQLLEVYGGNGGTGGSIVPPRAMRIDKPPFNFSN
ncbi:hypothetical protein JL49_09135 [Pseudoalteromonas luteoviolacea]|nr:hypothetical protein JL49_09135 [Pseudoalteromonas luteoviolacea]